MIKTPVPSLTELLDEIEQRAKDVQEKEYDSVCRYRHAVVASANDAPSLVKANRALLQFAQWMTHHPTFTKEAQRAIDEVAQLLREPVEQLEEKKDLG